MTYKGSGRGGGQSPSSSCEERFASPVRVVTGTMPLFRPPTIQPEHGRVHERRPRGEAATPVNNEYSSGIAGPPCLGASAACAAGSTPTRWTAPSADVASPSSRGRVPARARSPRRTLMGGARTKRVPHRTAARGAPAPTPQIAVGARTASSSRHFRHVPRRVGQSAGRQH